MKIIGVSASPRKNQSTCFALQQCLDEADSTGITTARNLGRRMAEVAQSLSF